MLNFFRSLTKSRLGLIAIFLVIGTIALAFVLGDVTGIRSSGGPAGNVVARVGDREITDRDLQSRISLIADQVRRQGRTFTIEQFLQEDGLKLVLDEMIDTAAVQEFAENTGIRVSKRAVDGELTNNPNFQGLDGKFDQKKYEAFLLSERVSDRLIRDELTAAKYGAWLLNPLSDPSLGPQQVPSQLASPYAGLLLERRQGSIALISTAAMALGAEPTQQELEAFYRTNRARYAVPERRVARYAAVRPDMLRAQTVPTDAEVAQAYAGSGDRYKASEKRTIVQVVAADQALANTIAGKVRGGMAIEQAARESGLEASRLTGLAKPAMVTQAGSAVADAAFAAARGAVIGPVRAQLGFAVLRVEGVETIAAKTLEQARPELVQELSARKLVEAMTALRNRVDDALGDGQTFDEIVASAKLQAQRSPALLPDGRNPDDPATQPDPAMAPVVRAAFAMQQGDDPELVAMGQDGSFALVAVERVVPRTQRPLDQVRAAVTRDFVLQRAHRAAREQAVKAVAALQKGATMQAAMAQAGAASAKIETFDETREGMRNIPQALAAPATLMFSMAKGSAKLSELPNNGGYFVIHLQEIVRRSPSEVPETLNRARAGIASVYGRELAEQFIAAMRKNVKVTINDKALQALRDSLARQGVSGN